MFAAVAGESWTLEKLSGEIWTLAALPGETGHSWALKGFSGEIWTLLGLSGEIKRARPGTRNGVLALCASYPVKPETGTRLTNLLPQCSSSAT